jgi:hypothetical protein
MAVVNFANAANQLFTYIGLSASDTGQPIFLDGGQVLSLFK